MADFLMRMLGQQPQAAPRPSSVPVQDADDDFADFSRAAEPTPASLYSGISSTGVAGSSPTPTALALPRPFTKWYRVWERVYVSDFYTEMMIVPFIILVVALHFWGTGKNRRKAKSWMLAHGPLLEQEFASVGFSGRASGNAIGASSNESDITGALLKEKSGTEFVTYATGRQNVAFVDVKLTLAKRQNPMFRFSEEIMSFFLESLPAPVERMEATAYVFDGRESAFVPPPPEGTLSVNKSSYDGFVWALVHKDCMKSFRDSRYDLSLTVTKDNAKLPAWATVMSEHTELTEALLTSELIKAVAAAGERLEALVVSDQPMDQPRSLNEAIPRKRITLSLRLPKGDDAAAHAPTKAIFSYFLRLADVLVNHGHFRPEVMRRVKATREEEVRKLKRADEDGKAEERRLKAEKEKKVERDNKLKLLSPEQQRKFLEKERAAEMRKAQKSRTVKG